MEHFLVVVRTQEDDLPLTIHYDLAEAIRKAHRMAKRMGRTPSILDEQYAILAIEPSEPLCVSVYQFRDRRLHMVVGSFLIDTQQLNRSEQRQQSSEAFSLSVASVASCS